jgi:hypothetical protein
MLSSASPDEAANLLNDIGSNRTLLARDHEARSTSRISQRNQTTSLTERGDTAVRTKHLLSVGMVAAGLLAFPSFAAAQDTSSGTLTVTATVESSIGLTFENDAAGVAMTGAGTNAATMALGSISAYNAVSTPGVTRTVAAADFTVSSPFGVKVVKANTSSASYTLAAALGSADSTNTWRIGSTTLSTSNSSLGATYSYGAPVAHTMYLTVPFTASTGSISKVLNFTATAN